MSNITQCSLQIHADRGEQSLLQTLVLRFFWDRFFTSEFLQSCPHLARTGFSIFSPFSAARAAVYISGDVRQVMDRYETRPVQTRAERSDPGSPLYLPPSLSLSLPLADSLAPAP